MNVSHMSFEGDLVGIFVAGSSLLLPGENLKNLTGSLNGVQSL